MNDLRRAPNFYEIDPEMNKIFLFNLGRDKAAGPSGTIRACGCLLLWPFAWGRSGACGTTSSRRSCSSTRGWGTRRLK